MSSAPPEPVPQPEPAPVPGARAPVLPQGSRSLAPDLARGFMLLLIAIANVSWHLWGHPTGLTAAHPVDGTPLDTVLAALAIVLVDGRIYPMFAFLFGYGMVQFSLSRAARGVPPDAVRRMLRRRHWWLIAFGFVHAVLLFHGDILGAYGLAGLVLGALFFPRTDRTLRIVSWVFAALLALWAVLSILAGALLTLLPEDAKAQIAAGTEAGSLTDWSSGQHNYLLAALARAGLWLLSTPMTLLMLTVPLAIVLGWLAARHTILDRPAEHRRLLVRIAVTGIAVGVLGGLPQGLAFLGALPLPEVAPWMFAGLHSLTGVAGGIGYAALFGLLALRLGEGSAAVRAVAAVGKRSLSFYLLQSVVFAPLLTAWGLGLGQHIGTTGAFGIATAVWLLSVVLAVVLERRRVRGPAEALLRRLTYGRDNG